MRESFVHPKLKLVLNFPKMIVENRGKQQSIDLSELDRLPFSAILDDHFVNSYVHFLFLVCENLQHTPIFQFDWVYEYFTHTHKCMPDVRWPTVDKHR